MKFFEFKAQELSPAKMSVSGNHNSVHVALLPSSGMGHLTPFLRLAVSLITHNVKVTFISTHPTVSLAESQTLSRFFSSFPQIISEQLTLLPFDNPVTDMEDPFYVQYEAIRRSSTLLSLILSSCSPKLSALITDMSLASSVIPVTQALSLPNFVFFTTSAKMLTLFLSFNTLPDTNDGLKIPGLQPVPKSWFPPPLLSDKTNLLKTHIIANGKEMIRANGILINTSESFEEDSLAALNEGKVINGLPQVIPIGPLPPCDFERSSTLTWLNSQAEGSVVYVSFGSRTAMTKDQIRELGYGLVRSECRFVWVVKEKIIDRDDDVNLDELLGHDLVERLKEKGLVVKHWVNQGEILSHQAIGGFVSHCGWNSVTEAIWHGIPMLAWPQHGDQKMNAYVVSRIGLGLWVENWEWGGGEMVVQGEEIGGKVKEMMSNESFRVQAAQIKGRARAAVEVEGSSKKKMIELVETWKNSQNCH